MPYIVLTRKACKTSVTFVLHEQKSTYELLRHSYSAQERYLESQGNYRHVPHDQLSHLVNRQPTHLTLQHLKASVHQATLLLQHLKLQRDIS